MNVKIFLPNRSLITEATVFVLSTVLTCACAQASTQTASLGPTYPVIEPDILELLKTHASESRAQTQEKLKQSQDMLQHYAKQPTGTSLPQASESKTVRIAVSPQATEVVGENFQRRWLLINANNADEIKLADTLLRNEKLRAPQQPTLHSIRVILVDGNVETTAQALSSRVWFDQGGRLVNKFGITATPTFIKMTAQAIYVTQAPAKVFLEKGSKGTKVSSSDRKEQP